MRLVLPGVTMEGTASEIVEYTTKLQIAQSIKNLSDIKIEVTELPKDPPKEEENHG